MPDLSAIEVIELCQEHGIDPNNADPKRECPICTRSGRTSSWLASKAVCEHRSGGEKEYSIRLECSHELCLFTTLLRRIVAPEPAPAPTIEEV